MTGERMKGLTEAQIAVLARAVDTGSMRAREALYEGGTSRTLAALATMGFVVRRHYVGGPLYEPTEAGRSALSRALRDGEDAR